MYLSCTRRKHSWRIWKWFGSKTSHWITDKKIKLGVGSGVKSGCEIVEKGLLALLLQTRIPLSVQPALKVCFGLNPSKHSPQPHNTQHTTHTHTHTQQFFPLGFPHSSVGKESTCNAGDPGSIPGSGRSSREGIGYPLQYSWASPVAQLVKNPPAVWETWVRSLSWEDL